MFHLACHTQMSGFIVRAHRNEHVRDGITVYSILIQLLCTRMSIRHPTKLWYIFKEFPEGGKKIVQSVFLLVEWLKMNNWSNCSNIHHLSFCSHLIKERCWFWRLVKKTLFLKKKKKMQIRDSMSRMPLLSFVWTLTMKSWHLLISMIHMRHSTIYKLCNSRTINSCSSISLRC